MDDRTAGACAPEEITAVTFTNQAAAEMRQRLCKQLGGKRAAARLTIGTFHAICLGLLGNVKLVSRGEALELAADALQAVQQTASPAKLLQAVSRVKNGASVEQAGISPELYEAYQNRLNQLGALDFDDLLAQALKLDVTGRRCFTHLLVDEFQDINDTQYELVRAWNRAGRTLFVIGDPDQAIYGFRGASSRCFARLRADVPGLQQICLQVNYRSTRKFCRRLCPLLNKTRAGPGFCMQTAFRGTAVRLVQAADDFNEAVFIAKEIGAMAGGVDMLDAQKLSHEREARAFSDIAVLCRTHRQLELIESCCGTDDIPCLVSGRESWLENDNVRGFLAFFRWLLRPDDAAALETALRLVWQCPQDLIQQAQRACARQNRLDLTALRQALPRAATPGNGLPVQKHGLPRRKPKSRGSWQSAGHKSMALATQWRNCSTRLCSTHRCLRCWTRLPLGRRQIFAALQARAGRQALCRLMTLHGAKGLEFPAVFLAGLSEGALPLEAKGRRQM